MLMMKQLHYSLFIVVSGWCKTELSWRSSFRRSGWSNCSSTFPYIKGLYRSKAPYWSGDKIHQVERANCCKGFENVKSDCVEINWSSSFEK